MLYWHLGEKRTGTTSLQAALVAQAPKLAAVGIHYPEEWRGGALSGYFTHDGLSEVIMSSSGAEPPARSFSAYLERHADESIVLSSEFVSDWLPTPKLAGVLRTLSAACATTPVRCLWTLRRLDDRLNSQCLRWALMGREDLPAPGPGDFMSFAASFPASLAGMRQIEGAVEGEVAYLKYSPDGAHNTEILRHLGLPAHVCRSLEVALESGPRLNSQLTHKGAVAVRCREDLSERIGFEIGRAELRQALFVGDFRFEDDRPCELLGGDVRRKLHREGLAAARREGIGAYEGFFEDDGIEECLPVSLGRGVVTDDDLERLIDHLRASPSEGSEGAIRQRYGG